MKRHKDALGIQQGARNVRAIARSLMEASDEAAREGIGAEQDAAVRMIVHQLAKVCNVDEIKYGYDPASLKDVYCTLMTECETRAKEISVQPDRAQASAEKREPPQLPSVTTVSRGDTVAVVVQGQAPAQGNSVQEAGEVEDLTFIDPERRRGFLTRFLFRGD